MAAKKNAKTKAPADAAKKAPKAKAAKPSKTKSEGMPKKHSAIDAAAKVLGENGEAMNCKEMIDAMAKKGYWTSPGGEDTPVFEQCKAITQEKVDASHPLRPLE